MKETKTLNTNQNLKPGMVLVFPNGKKYKVVYCFDFRVDNKIVYKIEEI